ncbi:conserved hypothetical protein [Neospora caninum Liverpool]|nr:conserved hypothetical protein [Neospora caninum Liverpool]CBZ51716.1 conserved hypothetical protein [Neospora caninum Liverpool]|eukprot:XP_003881749.1 conserved hypothetical protein [Neospora caninum Liverpool]
MNRLEQLRRGEGLLTFGVVQDSLAVPGPTVPGVDDPKNATPSNCSEWLTPSDLQRLSLPGAARWLPVASPSAGRFDRLRDLSLKDEEDEEQLLPGLKVRLREPVKRENTFQVAEPDAWHPASPSLIRERDSTNVGTRSTANVFPFERIQATQPSETRILGGYTEQLTAPFERAGATTEKFAYNPCAPKLPYTGLWHDEAPGISNQASDDHQLELLQKPPANRSDEAALLRTQAAKVCPRAAKVLLEDMRRDTQDAPDAKGPADLQERLFMANKQFLSDDERVENLMLAAVQPGLAPGAALRAQEQDQRHRQRGKAAAEAKARAITSFWDSRKPGSEARRLPLEAEPWQLKDARIQKEVEKSRVSLTGPELAVHRRQSHKRMIIYADRFFGDLGASPEEAQADYLGFVGGGPTTVPREISSEGRHQANAESLIARLEMRLTGEARGREPEGGGSAAHGRTVRDDSGFRRLKSGPQRRGAPDGECGTREEWGEQRMSEDVLGLHRAMRLAANLERDQEKEAEALGIPIQRRGRTKDGSGAATGKATEPPVEKAAVAPAASEPLVSGPQGKPPATSPSPAPPTEEAKALPEPPPAKKVVPGPPPKKTPPPPGAGKKALFPPPKKGKGGEALKALGPKIKLAFQEAPTHAASSPGGGQADGQSHAVSPSPEAFPKTVGGPGNAATLGDMPELATRLDSDSDEEPNLPLPLLLPQSDEPSAALSSWSALDAIRRTRFPATLRPKPVFDNVGRVILPPRRNAGAPVAGAEDAVWSGDASGIADASGRVSYKLVYDAPVYTGPSYEVMAEYQPELEAGAKPVGPGADTLIFEPAASRAAYAGSRGRRAVVGKERGRQGTEQGGRRRGREERSLLPRATQLDLVTRYPHDETSRASLSLLGVNDDGWVSSGVSRLANCVADLTTAPSALGVLEMLGEQGKSGKAVAEAAVWPAMLSEEGALGENVETLKQVECVVDGGFSYLKLEATPRSDAKSGRQHAGLSLWEQHSSAKKTRRHELVDSFGRVWVAPFPSRVFAPVHLMGKDSKFTKREEALQARYAYPEGQFSPGYYVKEPDVEETRQAMLQAQPPRMSVFEFQAKMHQLKLAKTREEATRAEIEEKAVEARLKIEEQKADMQFKMLKCRGRAEDPKKQVPDSSSKGEGATGLPRFVDLNADQLKERYRAIKKKNAQDKILPQIKSLIAERTDRPRTKVKFMGRHRHPKGRGKEVVLAEQKKKERILRMLAAPQKHVNTAALLAEIKALEREQGDDSDEFESVSTQYTYESFTVSSYDTVDDSFPPYTFNYPRYEPCSETFFAMKNDRLNYSGILLVSEDFRYADSKGLGLPLMNMLPTGGFLHHLMYVEARGTALFFYTARKFSKTVGGRLAMRPFAKSLEPSHLLVDGTEDWTPLFGVCVDASTEVEVLTVDPFSSQTEDLHYLAIRISGRNANCLPGAPPLEVAPPSKDMSASRPKKTAEERLAEAETVTVLLSADTEAETLLWHRLVKRRLAFAKYAKALAETTRDRPALSIAEFCLSGVNTAVLSLKGVPFNPGLDSVLLSNLDEEKKVSFLDLSYRSLNDADISELMDLFPFFAECVDLSCNQIEARNPVEVCKFINTLHATGADLSDNPLGERESGGCLLCTLLTQSLLSRLDLNRCRFGAEAAKAFRENAATIRRPVERPVTLSLTGNDLAAPDLVAIVTSVKAKIPGVKRISFANNSALTAEEFRAAVETSLHKVDLSIINFDSDQRSSPSLSTPISGDMSLLRSLPLTLSGRLLGAGWRVKGDRYVWSPAVKQFPPRRALSAETTVDFRQKEPEPGDDHGVPLVYFELRGPALIWSDVPTREAAWLCPEGQQLTAGKPRPTGPLTTDPTAPSQTVSGMLLYRVRVDFDAKPMILTVEGFDLFVSEAGGTPAPVTLPLLDGTPEQPTISYVLRGPTDAVTLEWARVLHARLAGAYYVRTEERSAYPLSQSALRFFESAAGTILDFGGCSVSPMGLKAIFFFLCKYTWLKSIIMCNMQLSGIHLRFLSSEAWQLYDLDLLDLSFNEFTNSTVEMLTSVLSFRSCDRLLLDRNPFTDTPEVADLFLKVGCGRDVGCFSLNGCCLGNRFAEALASGIKEKAPFGPHCQLSLVELQSNFIDEAPLRNLVQALVTAMPTLQKVNVFGNIDRGTHASVPFANFTQTFLDIPARVQHVVGPQKKRARRLRMQVGRGAHAPPAATVNAGNVSADSEGRPEPEQPAAEAAKTEGAQAPETAERAEGDEKGEGTEEANSEEGDEKGEGTEEANSEEGDEKSEGADTSDSAEDTEEDDESESAEGSEKAVEATGDASDW